MCSVCVVTVLKTCGFNFMVILEAAVCAAVELHCIYIRAVSNLINETGEILETHLSKVYHYTASIQVRKTMSS